MTAFLSGTSYAAIAAATATKALPGTVTVFSTPGTFTYTPPVGVKEIYVVSVAAGGGGASGSRLAFGNGRSGGGGGGAGAWSDCTIRGTHLGSTETVVVGAGGAGGASRSLNNNNGLVGSNGGDSSFGSFTLATGGLGGLAPSSIAIGSRAGSIGGVSAGSATPTSVTADITVVPLRGTGLAPGCGSSGGSIGANNAVYLNTAGGQAGTGTLGGSFGVWPGGNSPNRASGDISGGGGGAGGAAASFTLSATELITNGTFNADLSGWTVTNVGASTVTWDATGKASFQGDGTNTAYIQQAVTTVVGQSYLMTYDTNSLAIQTAAYTGVNKTGTNLGLTNLSVAAGGLIFVATTTTTYITFSRGSSGSPTLLDNVSTKLMTSIVAGGNGGNGGFPGGGGGGGGASMNDGPISGAGGTGGNGSVIIFESY
jgi:hypothetical protein